MNPVELQFQQARYAVEHDVQKYVQQELGNPWIALTINPLTQHIEVWYVQPAAQEYLICSRPFVTGEGMNIPQLIQHIREIELSDENMAQRVARLERENDKLEKDKMDKYLDVQMPIAEKIYREIDKELGGPRKLVYSFR